MEAEVVSGRDKNNASDWVDMMEADNVVGVRTVDVKELLPSTVEEFQRDIGELALEMNVGWSPYKSYRMERPPVRHSAVSVAGRLLLAGAGRGLKRLGCIRGGFYPTPSIPRKPMGVSDTL